MRGTMISILADQEDNRLKKKSNLLHVATIGLLLVCTTNQAEPQSLPVTNLEFSVDPGPWAFSHGVVAFVASGELLVYEVDIGRSANLERTCGGLWHPVGPWAPPGVALRCTGQRNGAGEQLRGKYRGASAR